MTMLNSSIWGVVRPSNYNLSNFRNQNMCGELKIGGVKKIEYEVKNGYCDSQIK